MAGTGKKNLIPSLCNTPDMIPISIAHLCVEVRDKFRLTRIRLRSEIFVCRWGCLFGMIGLRAWERILLQLFCQCWIQPLCLTFISCFCHRKWEPMIRCQVSSWWKHLRNLHAANTAIFSSWNPHQSKSKWPSSWCSLQNTLRKHTNGSYTTQLRRQLWGTAKRQ